MDVVGVFLSPLSQHQWVGYKAPQLRIKKTIGKTK
jgi:hypothetical protein